MSFTFRQGEGSRTTSRTINNVTAGVLTCSGTNDLDTALVGDVVEIFGSATAANNGFYTITAIVVNAGAADNYTLRPAPLDQGASGSAARLNRAAGPTLDASAVTSVRQLGASNLAMLEVAGANFRTRNVQPSDRLILSGSSTAANNGAWFIHGHPLSESMVIVRPPDGGVGMTTEAVGTGTVSVRRGVHRLFITNEAAFDWGTILASAVPLNGPSGGSPYFGSGEIRDYAESSGVATMRRLSIFGIGRITLDQSGLGADAAWSSLDEVIVSGRQQNPGSGGDLPGGLPIPFDWVGVPTTPGTILSLGQQLGNRYSVDNGGVWIGFNFSGLKRANFYGSFASAFGATNSGIGDGDVIGSVMRNLTLVGVSGGGVIESSTFYGSPGGALIVSGPVDIANVLIGSQSSGSNISVPGTVLAGLVLSDRVLGNFSNVSGVALTVLDPDVDFDLANFFIGGPWEKRYTFNPTFAQPDGPNGEPVPAVGLFVPIYEINETTLAAVLVFSGFTDANGQLNAGAGTTLRRQLREAGLSTFYTHRVGQQLYQMTHHVLTTLPIPQFELLGGAVPPQVAVATVTTAVTVRTPTVRVDPETGTVEVIDL